MTKPRSAEADAAPAANAGGKQQARGRPFPKGTSGNPRGRPAGSRPLALLKLDAIAEDEAAAIVRRLATAARKGDTSAAAQLLARVWPPRRGRPVALPELATAGTTEAAFSATLAAIAEGRLTIEEGESVSRILMSRAQVVELADLARRLDALEARETPTEED